MTKLIVDSRSFANAAKNVTDFHERLTNNMALETTKISYFKFGAVCNNPRGWSETTSLIFGS